MRRILLLVLCLSCLCVSSAEAAGAHSDPEFLDTLPNGVTLFAAKVDGMRGLWRTDGTDKGTWLITNAWTFNQSLGTINGKAILKGTRVVRFNIPQEFVEIVASDG